MINEYYANVKGYENLYQISCYGTIKSVDKVVKNKIELVCYCGDSIEYKKNNDNFILTSPLKFIPYNLKFDEEQMKQLINMLLKGDSRLKITIEKVED